MYNVDGGHTRPTLRCNFNFRKINYEFFNMNYKFDIDECDVVR